MDTVTTCVRKFERVLPERDVEKRATLQGRSIETEYDSEIRNVCGQSVTRKSAHPTPV